jgi:hypothetical protein
MGAAAILDLAGAMRGAIHDPRRQLPQRAIMVTVAASSDCEPSCPRECNG